MHQWMRKAQGMASSGRDNGKRPRGHTADRSRPHVLAHLPRIPEAHPHLPRHPFPVRWGRRCSSRANISRKSWLDDEINFEAWLVPVCPAESVPRPVSPKRDLCALNVARQAAVARSLLLNSRISQALRGYKAPARPLDSLEENLVPSRGWFC